jgi:predicted GNAT family acetyltransferase
MSADPTDDLRLVDAPERRRFEILSHDDAEPLAIVDYERRDRTLLLMHTEVRPDLEGRGIGTRTAELVVDHLRRSGQLAIVGCPFLTAWLRRHPDEQDILARPLQDRPPAPRPDGPDRPDRAGGA